VSSPAGFEAEPRSLKGFPLFSALRTASPDTIILLIVDYYAAIGGKTPLPRNPCENRTMCFGLSFTGYIEKLESQYKWLRKILEVTMAVECLSPALPIIWLPISLYCSFFYSARCCLFWIFKILHICTTEQALATDRYLFLNCGETWRPTPRCIQPLLVRDMDGKPPGRSPAVHCFCVCVAVCTVGRLPWGN